MILVCVCDSPDGLHDSHTNGAVGGAVFKTTVDPPIMSILTPLPRPQPHPLTPAHVSGQNFDPFAFQKLKLGHM